MREEVGNLSTDIALTTGTHGNEIGGNEWQSIAHHLNSLSL